MNPKSAQPESGSVFLTARWQNLAMLNYQVPRDLVQPYVPGGLELDDFEGQTYVSLVGFEFINTRLKGWSIPGHAHFPEVNLRLYVKRQTGAETRRGVIFIKEIVPRWAVATVARWIYNEPYSALPMKHHVNVRPGSGIELEYAWKFAGQWCSISAASAGQPASLVAGSAEEFIAEHYWGYGRLRNGRSVEYHVAHPPWEIWPNVEAKFTGDPTILYGPKFAKIVRQMPTSAFIATGSEVTVHAANVLPVVPLSA